MNPQFASDQPSIPTRIIERKIYLIRGQKVMLDSDLAELYGVPTKALNQAVKRNPERFPEDFMFQLTWDEGGGLLRSQFVTLKRGRHLKFQPYVFTGQGVAMLSSVLKSKRAIQVNLAIVRVFVRIREALATHKDLERKIGDLEKKYAAHDMNITQIFSAIRLIMQPPRRQSKRRIGFVASDDICKPRPDENQFQLRGHHRQ